MGINDIRLSAELIASLYPEILVAENNPDPGKIPVRTGLTQTKMEPGYSFLGKNLRNICFLVNYPDDEFIPEDQFTFLQKILTACKLSLNDITLINTNKTAVELQALQRQFQSSIIFFWGNAPDIMGMNQNFPDMTISAWGNIQILPVMQAEMMSWDNPRGLEMKRNLWISLKKLFNL